MVPAEDRRGTTSFRGGGWFASAYDANDLMRVFDTLWLKAGFALHAYVYREGSNGNGIIWAVPADAPLIAPEECPRLDDTWLQPPRPPGAVWLIQAIEGDGSPWSYLSASILCREAAEFGAVWHGCVCTDQTIISKPPRQTDGRDTPDDGGSTLRRQLGILMDIHSGLLPTNWLVRTFGFLGRAEWTTY